MTVVIRISTERLAGGARHEEFDGVREVDGWVRIGGHRGRSLLEATNVRCQVGGRLRSAAQCLECPRFVNYVPIDDRRISIRCVWTADDLVRDLMTLATQAAVVAPSMPVGHAAMHARTIGVGHLLVCEGDALVGVACRCALVPPILAGEVVGDRMADKVWTISDTDRLGDAVAVMIEHDVGFLPVVRRGVVLGVISRGDLLAAGVGDALVDAHQCEACGSVHGIRPHPTIEGVSFCLDCLELRLTDADFDEIGCETGCEISCEPPGAP